MPGFAWLFRLAPRSSPVLFALVLLSGCAPSGSGPSADATGDARTADPVRDASTAAEEVGEHTPRTDAGGEPNRGDANIEPETGTEASARDAGGMPARVEGGLGGSDFAPGELDPSSHGGTLTFQQIGAKGWYPSRRDPALGGCDAYQSASCCMARREVTSDQLTPWDEELMLSLRGPLSLKQLAVYQPDGAAGWRLVSAWDNRAPSQAQGIAFRGDGGSGAGFQGAIGSECLVDVSSDAPFVCGTGSSPFCPASGGLSRRGWAGSKLFVLLASMPHAGQANAGKACGKSADGNWYDAPWLGLSLAELVRAGAFSNCHCYARNPDEWWLGDGCGQFNVFEVVNDNNQYRNLEVFSTNFFGYGGYVGEGPCGSACDVTKLAADVDLIDKTTHLEAARGALSSPSQGPGAAFRRPLHGYRYFLVQLDVAAREVQLAIVHPRAIPTPLARLLPDLPTRVPQATVDALRALRLPR